MVGVRAYPDPNPNPNPDPNPNPNPDPNPNQAPWLKLLTAPDVGVVVVQRGGVENFCSIKAAKETLFWGHSPAQCAAARDECAEAARLKAECVAWLGVRVRLG